MITAECSEPNCDNAIELAITDDRPDEWSVYNGRYFCPEHTPEQVRMGES